MKKFTLQRSRAVRPLRTAETQLGISVLIWLLTFAGSCQRINSNTNANVTSKANTSPRNVNANLTSASATNSESLETANRNETQRLARAAEVRSYMREQDIPATVVASGTVLSIQYEAASGDFLPEIFQTFCRQQNTASLKAAGFENVEIRARDSSGVIKSRTFRLSSCAK